MSYAVSTLGIVGGGFMGMGIAETAAVGGIPVVVRELPEYLDSSRSRLLTSMERAVQRGKLDVTSRDAALELVSFTSELKDLGGVDLVIEAVPEDVHLKSSIMKAIDEIVGPETTIATNTSAIPIAVLARVVQNPERVLGIHFFSPVPVMRLVEIVRALDTSEAAIAVARGFAEQLKKHAIETKDRAGFVVNFLLFPYVTAAVRMYEQGFASREDIDDGMKFGAGHPMGPLTLCDFIGLDVVQAVCGSLYEEFKYPEYYPPPLMKRMVDAGRLGRKSGRGFYEYDETGNQLR